MVCKISGNTKRKFNFITRLVFFFSGGEDAANRHETFFYQKVAPHLTDTTFKFPKVFFAGTVFPHIVSAETIHFLNLDIVANSNS